ncbi:hypothetical protein [Microbacterium sp. SORGH_AS_0344]|uniref:hypothetical protein n=1 Tax=Microbacterium sp. SORGH_AS_0344 TaxID=3041767 RepID=UPI00278A7A1D|nr:hypothetical protein [Microbacterium sp. SORGH_AS_0344]MDQ1084928.1 hypothetical protein [Microbacterium sp. SORGH_AS_0344]
MHAERSGAGRGDGLYTREQLLGRGVVPRVLERASHDGPWLRLQSGMYVDRESHLERLPAERHRIVVGAASASMRGGFGVVSHLSAAVVHGLPQYRFADRPVEVTLAGDVGGSSRAGLRRHLDALDDEDIVEIDGIVCTSLDRTVFDVARTASLEMALTCADAALRREAVSAHRFDAAAQEEWRRRMRDRAERAAGRRGIRSARRVIEFADGRSQLPGESVSRLQLHRLGFREIDLQVPVAGPHGFDYFVDIALGEVRTFWEFDGEVKYRDPEMRGGRSVEAVVLDEKRREDWIRGVTQWRLCRGGFGDIRTPEALAARLAAFGVRAPR